jgi:hypothetical protein
VELAKKDALAETQRVRGRGGLEKTVECAVGEHIGGRNVQREYAVGVEWGFAAVVGGCAGEVVMPRKAGYSPLSLVYRSHRGARNMCVVSQCVPYRSIQAGVIVV